MTCFTGWTCVWVWHSFAAWTWILRIHFVNGLVRLWRILLFLWAIIQYYFLNLLQFLNNSFLTAACPLPTHQTPTWCPLVHGARFGPRVRLVVFRRVVKALYRRLRVPHIKVVVGLVNQTYNALYFFIAITKELFVCRFDQTQTWRTFLIFILQSCYHALLVWSFRFTNQLRSRCQICPLRIKSSLCHNRTPLLIFMWPLLIQN